MQPGRTVADDRGAVRREAADAAVVPALRGRGAGQQVPDARGAVRAAGHRKAPAPRQHDRAHLRTGIFTFC
jgi:hypothetical protein